MKVMIFGATGMVGQGVLRECLRDADVTQVLTVGRTATGQLDPRLHELVRRDLTDYTGLDDELSGYDACFYCLGVSSVGMQEADYARITYDLTHAAASVLARLNPSMTFVYVSGRGTDSSEQGRVMWARVKGRTENALRRLPFNAVYLFRPSVIQPLHGVRSKTRLYDAAYVVLAPLLSTLRRLFPAQVQTTESLGQAMLEVARRGAPQAVLEPADLNRLASA